MTRIVKTKDLINILDGLINSFKTYPATGLYSQISLESNVIAHNALGQKVVLTGWT